MKLWGGRFRGRGGVAAEEFTASISFDRRLYRQDIAGSIAHARMLGKVGVLDPAEVEAIVGGLEEIRTEIDDGRFEFRVENEDIHGNIERRLIEKIGPVGGKLHTARSRNDQVALDMHMFMREEIGGLVGRIGALQAALLDQAEANLGTVMPGYTHLQRAQPVLFSHHLLAYYFMLDRDSGRFADCLKRTDLMPLGAGALAGTTFPIDREAVAADLGFSALYENSIDAVSDRDFLLEFLAAASITMMHLSRLAEEFVLWSSAEFGFIEIDDAYATGSSIMPQKKNPDVAELVRGKTGRVYGNLLALLVVMKGLPLAYHSDMQEDKERAFDALDTLAACLEVFTGMVATLKVKAERLARAVREDFSNATEVADYLARKGIPFRQAHEVAGRLVLAALDSGRFLADLTMDEFRAASPLFETDIYAALSPESCVAGRRSRGGTAPERVAEVIRALRGRQGDGA